MRIGFDLFAVERIQPSHRGAGHASEAATLRLIHARETPGLRELVSFTAVSNLRSQAMRERIGMQRDPCGDFEHPRVADGSLRRHARSRVPAASWRERRG